MRREAFESRAVVLRTVPYGEADLIVSLLTLEAGKRSGFARGARKSSRRFRGGLHPLSLVRARLAPRGHDSLDVLSESEVVGDMSTLGRNLAAFAAASVASEFTDTLLDEQQGDAELFGRLVRLLEWLRVPERRPELCWVGLNRYMQALLDDLGVTPDWGSLGRSDSDDLDEVVGGFSPDHGLLARAGVGQASGIRWLTERQVRYLAAVQSAKVPEPGCLDAGAAVGEVLRDIAAAQSQRAIKSWDFVRGALPGS